MTITELVDEETARLISKGDGFDVEDLYEAVNRRRDEIEDDALGKAIWAQVRQRDKTARAASHGQLSFGGHTLPEVLVVGKTRRQPSSLAVLRDVLTDQGVKEQNFLSQSEAMQALRRRNLVLLPYLEKGMTVAQAIEAWEKDQA